MCSDEDTEGRWQPRVTTCQVTAARAAFYAEHKDTGPETMLAFALLPDGEAARDPLAFDPARAQAERDAMEARIAAI